MEHTLSLQLRDLYAIYKQIIQEDSSRKMTRREICRKISTLPAPQLYIEPKFAWRIIRVMEGGRLRANSPRRSRQHHELYRRWLALPDEERTPANIEKILAQPAPSFYLSPSRIYILLYKAVKL